MPNTTVQSLPEMPKPPDTAVILHLYFPELWDDIDSYLKNFERKFDLFVSVPFHIDPVVINTIKEQYPDARIIRFENRGRDVAPFMEIFSAIAPAYKYICKIHSKKSSHRSDGAKWRQDLYGDLLGSAQRIDEIRNAFDNNPLIGMIGPTDHAISIRSTIFTGFDVYKNILTYWAQKIGAMNIAQLDYYFFAGTMFWFRSAALLPILKLNMPQENFEMESGALDGTLAHALERFFPVAIFSAGYQVFDTDTLSSGTPSRITPSYSKS
ncbi:MAG: rhamnan synthesis F family protein [Burkholderiales bacterium]